MKADGAALRRTWDAACDGTVEELRRARRAAEVGGRPSLAQTLGRSIDDVRFLQSAVDARRRPPGSCAASGLVHDLPQDLVDPPYRTAGDALLELSRFYEDGMDVDWDWSRGFPPDWPVTWRERLLGGRLVLHR